MFPNVQLFFEKNQTRGDAVAFSSNHVPLSTLLMYVKNTKLTWKIKDSSFDEYKVFVCQANLV